MNIVKTKVFADVRQPGYGPVHRHRETQQLQAHLPEPLGPLQVLITFDGGHTSYLSRAPRAAPV